jgi:hypothetical protein
MGMKITCGYECCAAQIPGRDFALCTVLHPSLHQAGARLSETGKLKVDNLLKGSILSSIDICLLSFGYRAIGSRPERTFLSKIAIIIRNAPASAVSQYCYERVHHDHWHS